MALLNKLFASRKKSFKSQCKTADSLELPRLDIPFSKDQIRVLVFRECEWRGRKLLFDLKSIKKTEPGCQCTIQGSKSFCAKTGEEFTSPSKHEGYVEVTQNGIAYQYLRPRPDVKMLGEMIFGSVAMSYKGITIKIHNIRSPPQLMFSKVFPAPTAHSNECDRDLESSLQSSGSDFMSHPVPQTKLTSSVAHSVPVDVPAQMSFLNADDDVLDLLTPSSLRSNSSFNSVHSFQRSPEGSNSSLNSLTRSGSLNSLNRRWLRTVATSMDFGLQRMSEELSSNEDKPIQNARRNKLGVSVVISLSEKEEYERDFQSFFFSHITLIEGYINKLSLAVEKAYVQRKQFVHLLMQGVESIQRELYDLYMAPRFPDPVWLCMMSPVANRHVICLKFMTEFMSLIEQYDNKNTNFFISTLLTAVLAHHLAWVPTVTPSGLHASQSFHEKHTAKWLDILAKRHPYNPLWVQLGDLYGGLGIPSKMAKTIIVGTDADLVRNVMYCLTYFIRCSEVYEKVESRISPSFRQRVMSASSNSSGGTLMGDSFHSTQHDGLIPHATENGSDSESDALERSREKLPSLARNSVRRSVSGLCDLVKLEKVAGVERQEGEGDDEDEVPDEQFEKVHLRAGRRSCETCDKVCSCKKSARHGIIFDSSSNGAVSQLKNCMQFIARGTQCGSSRDSGIDSFVEIDRTKTTNSAQNKTSAVVSEKLKRKGANGKVSFTIGNIPLEDICSPASKESREMSPVSDYLVCTCGKHVPGSIKSNIESHSKSNITLNGFERSSNPPKISLSSVNAKLIGMSTSANNRVNRVMSSDQSCDLGMSKNSSLACDSGIHSCEESRTDLVNCRTSNVNASHSNEVEALQIKVPQIRRERELYVGRSRTSTSWIAKNEHFIDDVTSMQPKSCSVDRLVPDCNRDVDCSAGNCSESKVEQCKDITNDNCRTYPENDYERSNSIFDEYFDENIELKMLDEESFQEKMKERRNKESTKLKNVLPAVDNRESGSCKCQNSKCFSRDSLLDGQEGNNCCNSLLSKHDNDSLFGVQCLENDRNIIWNSALDTIEESNSKFFENAIEIELPKSETKQPTSATNEGFRGFGWSLLANYVDHYMSDFALQGTQDMKFGKKLTDDLKMTVKMPILDEPVSEAVCIVANTNNWTVELVSSRHAMEIEENLPKGVRVTPSQLIAGMAEALLHLWKLKMSPAFCLMHLEDRLQEFYFKSKLLSEHFLEIQTIDAQKVAIDLGLDASDLPLLFAISSIHS